MTEDKKSPSAKDMFSFCRAIGMQEMPQHLIRDSDATKTTIEFLKGFAKIQEGKYVSSTRGIGDKIRHYLLGYPVVSSPKEET